MTLHVLFVTLWMLVMNNSIWLPVHISINFNKTTVVRLIFKQYKLPQLLFNHV